MTDQELKDLVASVAVQQKETSAQQKETSAQQKETSAQQKETSAQMKETDRKLRELGRQLGGLGDKFGSFTEGLALPSMTRILSQRFGMDFIAPRVRKQRNGHSLELDVLASSDARKEVFVVEVKSHLREEALEQMRKILRSFREFFPDQQDKKVFGVIAAVDAPENVRKRVLAEGFYLASIHDGQFEIQVPEGFQPRAY